MRCLKTRFQDDSSGLIFYIQHLYVLAHHNCLVYPCISMLVTQYHYQTAVHIQIIVYNMATLYYVGEARALLIKLHQQQQQQQQWQQQNAKSETAAAEFKATTTTTTTKSPTTKPTTIAATTSASTTTTTAAMVAASASALASLLLTCTVPI